MEPRHVPLQFAFPLPKNQHITIHVHLTFFTTNTVLFLTSTLSGETATANPMGSFVYAMPNVRTSLSEIVL
jgi:Proteasome assembly chaperone 4